MQSLLFHVFFSSALLIHLYLRLLTIVFIQSHTNQRKSNSDQLHEFNRYHITFTHNASVFFCFGFLSNRMVFLKAKPIQIFWVKVFCLIQLWLVERLTCLIAWGFICLNSFVLYIHVQWVAASVFALNFIFIEALYNFHKYFSSKPWNSGINIICTVNLKCDADTNYANQIDIAHILCGKLMTNCMAFATNINHLNIHPLWYNLVHIRGYIPTY